MTCKKQNTIYNIITGGDKYPNRKGKYLKDRKRKRTGQISKIKNRFSKIKKSKFQDRKTKAVKYEIHKDTTHMALYNL